MIDVDVYCGECNKVVKSVLCEECVDKLRTDRDALSEGLDKAKRECRDLEDEIISLEEEITGLKLLVEDGRREIERMGGRR